MIQYKIRKAVFEDCKEIEKLITLSARGLSLEYYSQEQIEGALQGAFGIDTQLIKDETYFVVEAGEQMIGCGGWSKRKTLFGGDKREERDPVKLNPKSDSAKIRAFFVHPDWARKGIGKMVFDKCEMEAKLSGFTSLELMSTLPGVKFYQSCGFTAGETIEYKLPSGNTIIFLPMKKRI